MPSAQEEEAIQRLREQVLEELNIEYLRLMRRDSRMLAYTLKPQFKVLGAKYGPVVQKILAYFKTLTEDEAQAAAEHLNTQGKLDLTFGETHVSLTSEEVQVVSTARPGYVAAEEHGYVTAIDTTITQELREKGWMRDLVHYVQDMRKKAGLNIEDHIGLALYTDSELADVILDFAQAIRANTLADNLLISISEEKDKPAFTELYRESISPTSAKKLDKYTIEVVIGKM